MAAWSWLIATFVVLGMGVGIVATARAIAARPPRLRPISAQAHDRFGIAWNRIAGEFLHSPREATREAEDLVYNLLVARGHPTTRDRLPASLHEAKRWSEREREDGTEALRQTMLHYRIVFENVLGRRPGDEPDRQQRRAMA